MKQTIVAIEDEPDLLEVLEYNLGREGYQVEAATDGDEGLELIFKHRPDLVLLDLMLPGIDGLEICRRVRSESSTRSVPIIMVSAKGEESDIILGLELGADDYVTKPFSPRELVARVRSVLRRSRSASTEDAESPISLQGLSIDPLRHEVMIDREPAEFTATEFRILHFMASHPGRVYTREQLIRSAVGEDVVILERNIDVHIRAMRHKLGAHADLIETIRGVGYRFADAAMA